MESNWFSQISRRSSYKRRMKPQLWLVALVLVWLASASEAFSQSRYVPPPAYLFGRLDLAAGDSPVGVATGDFNGDGKRDLAVVENSDNVVSVYLGKPDGTFQPKVDYAVGNGPQFVVVGDFNNDGKLDLAVTNFADGTVSILLGNGDGTFQKQTVYTVGSGPLGIVAGDFNGDGRLDLAVALYYGSGVAIMLGQSGGGFTISTINTGVGPSGVVAGDYSGDGKLDLAVSNQGSGTVSVLLGNGDGTFQSPVNYATGPNPCLMAVGDFNGDGKLDVAVGHNPGNTVSVLLGNANGTFQPRVDYPVGTTPALVLAVDLNGDGFPDLVATNNASANISVLLSNGDGTFLRHADYGVGFNPLGAAAWDFNGDGRTDLVVANRCGMDSSCKSPGTVSVLVGKGDGTFPKHVDAATGTKPDAIAVGDFNNDGKLDLAVADFGSSNLTILLGNGNGTFTAMSSLAVGTQKPTSLAVGDFNGDGNLDLVVQVSPCGACLAVSVFFGNGDGTFGPLNSVTWGYEPSSVAVGDFNGDGHLDLAVADLDNFVQIMLGDGQGNFNISQGTRAQGVNQPGAMAVGDFNNDGKLDLAVLDYCSVPISGGGCSSPPTSVGAVTIDLGKGDGTFSTKSTPLTGMEPVAIAAGDFNGDGKLDLAVANSGSNNLTILLGNGDGTFTAAPSPATGNAPTSVAVGDFNGDGKLDLAAVNSGNNTIGIFLGNGDGTFQNQVVYTVGAAPSAVAAAILAPNGQGGGQDVVVANSGSNSVTVFHSTPVPAFYPSSLTFVGQPVGLPSTAGSVTLSNSGTARLDLADIQASGDFTETTTCGTYLKPGANCTLSTVFTPSTTGTRLGAITLNDNAPANPQVVALVGTGLEASATLNPSSLTFVRQKSGTTSAARNVTLTNNGDAPLTITSITTTAEFSQTNTCGSFVNVAKSCTISVKFAPSATGVQTGVLSVLDNAGNLGQDVALSGTGTAADAVATPGLFSTPVTAPAPQAGTSAVDSNMRGPEPASPPMLGVVETPDALPTSQEEASPPPRGIAALSTHALPFASQALRTASAPRGVTLTNIGNALLEIHSIATSGADFAETNNCGFSLPAGANCSIQVTFSPTKTGRIEGSLKIDVGDDEPHKVLLYGPGEGPSAPTQKTAPPHP